MAPATIQRLLVANRGEIARRVFRTCRALGIQTVAVFSEPDAGAPFALEADVAVALGGSTPAESYLRGDALLAAALRAGADAIHPGYGFLAENAAFAQSVVDAGVTWVGPTPETIARMGSKIEAREWMERSGVPVLPADTLGGSDGAPNGDLEAAAAAIGYPLMVKASAGGGGKGMRIVRDAGELVSSCEAARREAVSAFGDGAVFLERYLERPRHVEIQIVGDGDTVVSLFERDCSIQRRHQKVVEESPSPAVGPELRDRMGAAAVAVGRALGYVGAGTVEFLLAPSGEFFFLEVNTRLQVEHPVTEMVTGLDLVALQLLVAEGRRLPPEALEPRMRGHAIEVRLYAEDPADGFMPVSGTLGRFSVPEGARIETGVESGSIVSPYYDPMLAKVIVHADTRELAARKLADVLERSVVDGLVTNRDFLVRVLRHPQFLAGETDTHFLERHDPAELGAPAVDPAAERLHAAAAALAAQAARRAAGALRMLPSGWRNNPSSIQRAAFGAPGGELAVGYAFDRRGALSRLEVSGEPVPGVRLHGCTPELVDLEADGIRRRYAIRTGADGAVHVQSDLGAVTLRALPRFPAPGEEEAPPGSLTAPMHGTVVRVLAGAGEPVRQGQVLLVLEAMKMEQEIVAPASGVLVELLVRERAHVERGALLAVVRSAQD